MLELSMKNKYIIFLFTFFISTNSFSQINIIAGVAKSWANEDKKSFAGTLIKKITQTSSIKVTFQAKPLVRAVNGFVKKDYNCFFGGNKDDFQTYMDTNLLISSDNVLQNHVRVLTLKKNRTINNIKDISNLRGSHINGMKNVIALNKRLPELKNIINVKDISQALEMIKRNRIDYIIHWSPLTKEFKDLLHFNNNLSLHALQARMNCYKDSKTIEFIDDFNLQLKKLKKIDYVQKSYKSFLKR